MTGSVDGESRRSRTVGSTPTAGLVQRYVADCVEYGMYPSQQRLTASFTTDDYRQHALASNELPLPAPLALCIRVPSSSKLQRGSAAVAGNEIFENYVNCLYRELALQGLLFDSDRVVEELHIGAGNGTQLGVTDVESIMTHVDRHFTVQQAAHREISVFASAISGGLSAIASLAGLGINRIQLGRVGDKADTMPRSIAFTFESAAQLIETARVAGMRSVGADIWYGFAGQTVRGFEQTITRLLSLGPDRVAIRDDQKRDTAACTAAVRHHSGLPDATARFDMLIAAHDIFGGNGYRHLGNGHYVLAGDDLASAQDNATLSYTTLGYTGHGRCDWIGLGAAAIGNVHNCYAENAPDVEAYIDRLSQNRLAVTGGYTYSLDDRIRHSINQSIMCTDKLEYDNIERRFGIEFQSYFADELAALESLARDGMVNARAGELTLSQAGKLMRSQIARVFDRFAD